MCSGSAPNFTMHALQSLEMIFAMAGCWLWCLHVCCRCYLDEAAAEDGMRFPHAPLHAVANAVLGGTSAKGYLIRSGALGPAGTRTS